MKDKGKTKEQLIEELEDLHKQIIELKEPKTNIAKVEDMLVQERIMKTLFENLPQRIFYKDRNSVYVSCNENYANDLKIKPGDITGKTDYNFYPRDLAEKYRADDKRIMESWKTEDIEEKYIIEGKEYFVNTVKTPVKDKKGNVVGILGIFWDITEHRHTENMLKYNEERYRRIVETANEGIWIIDAESKTTFANKKMSEMLGYNVEEIIGLSLFEFMDEEWREIAKVNVERCMQGIIEQHDFKFRRKDGGVLWAIVSANPFFDKEGRYIGALGMITDITDYKRSVEKIHSQAGYDILKVIEFPWPIAQIVLQHHERMNGSGYPSGLYGKGILLEARILTIADVVEAMASYRPYRPAQNIDKALEEISQNRGILYDSDAANACLRLFREKGFSLD